MKIVKADYNKGFVKVLIEKAEDLWHISHVLVVGDNISGKTWRRVDKTGEANKKVDKKSVFLKINVVKIEFQRDFNNLRVLGTVVEGPDDVAKGSHHSFQLEIGSSIEVEKKEAFLGFQKKHLEDAAKKKEEKILICAIDRGEGAFALLTDYGFEYLGSVEGATEKKDKRVKEGDDFYKEIIKNLEEYDERYHLFKIIIGSPAFWKDELYKKLSEGLSKKAVLVTCNSNGEVGIREILKRNEIKKVLKEEKVAEEVDLVEEILKEIGKSGKVVYGFQEVRNAVTLGAVEKLLVSDRLIKKLMEENNFISLDEIMRLAEKINAEVHVVSHEHEGGAKLDGLGGVAAILRYKIE